MTQNEKKKRTKEILNNLLSNSFNWVENEGLTEGLTEDEINEIDMMLDKYIIAIAKRYRL